MYQAFQGAGIRIHLARKIPQALISVFHEAVGVCRPNQLRNGFRHGPVALFFLEQLRSSGFKIAVALFEREALMFQFLLETEALNRAQDRSGQCLGAHRTLGVPHLHVAVAGCYPDLAVRG